MRSGAADRHQPLLRLLLLPRKPSPHMVSKKSGKILNVSSMWGRSGASCEAAYSASKAGIQGLTQALAKELAPSNIQVNAIAFGVIGHRHEPDARCRRTTRPRRGDPCRLLRLTRRSSPDDLEHPQRTRLHDRQIIGFDGGFL